MTSVLEALGAQRLRDSIARQGERLAGQARTGPAPGQVFGLSPNFLVTVTSLGLTGCGQSGPCGLMDGGRMSGLGAKRLRPP
ncbi:lipoprotein [Abiotrophia defectiva]|uniref:lipoprotein n=1 Tax=Abiotrophia defectiva TaxID=46125 RepID=UPI0037BE6006